MQPTIFTICGVTGDWATRKIVPSLWYMYTKKMLPEKIAVIGVGRTNLTDAEFKAKIFFSVTAYGKSNGEKEINKTEFEKFYQKFSYISGSLESPGTFVDLAKEVGNKETKLGVANKLFYFAVPPNLYANTFKNLAQVKLNTENRKCWTRVLIEKPIGGDLKSAKKLIADLRKFYKESQIYLMDHYFYKEILNELENDSDKNTWSKKNIGKIEITTNETANVYERGAFYDSVGALVDVGQNHLLAVLATLTMKNGKNLSAKALHKNRANVLEELKKWTPKILKENTYRAQHVGYTNIKGVNENSQKETYFKVKTAIVNKRWEGVQIYLEAGKSLGETRKEIIITFQDASRKVFNFERKNKSLAGLHYVGEYSKILADVMGGGAKHRFVSFEEVFASWKFVDPVVNAWRKGMVDLVKYKEGETPKSII